MAGLNCRIVGIVVISAGVCAALPFRSNAVKVPVGARQTEEFSRAGRSQSDLTLRLTLPSDPGPSSTFNGQQGASSTADTLRPREVRRDELQAPPKLPSTFEMFGETLLTAKEPVPPIVDRPVRRHQIADGDTLEILAERYLGGRGDWQLILEANDELLAHPDILPIGKQITIPPVTTPLPEDPDGDLVPIPPGLLGRDHRALAH